MFKTEKDGRRIDNKISYDRIAGRWAEYRDALPLNQCIADFAGRIRPAGKVLDIGCGTGYPIDTYLSGNGFTVTGIDNSAGMLEKAAARNIPNAAFYLCDFFEFCPRERFDAIVAFDVFFHLQKSRQAEIYRIVSGWLVDGGYLLFTHGKNDGECINEMFGEEFYYSALELGAVLALLDRYGFAVEVCIEGYKEAIGERELLIVARKVK